MPRFVPSLLVAASAITAVALAAPPATADREAHEATGTTRLTVNNKTLAKFTEDDCGLLTVTPIGDAQIKLARRGFEVLLPVTKVVLKDDQENALRVEHDDAGVQVENSCYAVRMTGFRLDNFSDSGDGGSLNVEARLKSDDENDSRRAIFTLDLTSANQNTSQHRDSYTKQIITNAGLYLAPEGAAEFNQLVTGSESTGPFSANDQIGAGKTQIKYAD